MIVLNVVDLTSNFDAKVGLFQDISNEKTDILQSAMKIISSLCRNKKNSSTILQFLPQI